MLETGKLALRSGEVAARQGREELNILMGLWGNQTEWQTDGRLPDIPQQPMQTENIERIALDRSVDLLNARQRLVFAGEQLGFNRWTALLPEMQVGTGSEREEDGSWKVGPVFEFPIPLFDQGQARIGRSGPSCGAHSRNITLWRCGFAPRLARSGIEWKVRGIAPCTIGTLCCRCMNESSTKSQLQYNAMQLGPIHYLRAREQQIETAVAYIEALRDYWLARGDIGQF